ncbi:rhodanese-like domain-containing protein [Flavobacterium sp. NKUCC04_CG]|uniref:rhodanese-like domain-containing protein n=1 Tax=Flavobacterium sp. NKUCC04_CG TaxID=2842121 RepID=UPI001C5B7A22|nr:rhodanese-like domain-containing protein [Flavobacterium sp. NKUCC04_CG]MBW3517872.1 rhodanese-like domain-containing protein [Flavobacterium sp. NKUCC04_CG]
MKMNFFALLLMSFLVFSCQGQTASKEYLLKAADFENQWKTEKGLMLDVRTAAEFKEGHIEGAKNIDFLQDDFEANTAQLDKNQPIYVYCKSGGRSAKAIEKLRKQGFTNLYELEGGYGAWKANTVTQNKK